MLLLFRLSKHAKQEGEEEEEQGGEMGIIYNPSKIKKLNAIPLIELWGILTAEKDATEGFSSQYKSIRLLYNMVCEHSIRNFP